MTQEEISRSILNRCYNDYPNEIEEFISFSPFVIGGSESLYISTFEKFMENNNLFI